jgi:hypothetical protein
MEKSGIIKPNPWCQEEIWKLIYGINAELNYVDNPWFPTVIKFTVSRDSIIIEDESTKGRIELQKGRITVVTRSCVLDVTKYAIWLHQYFVLEPEEGRWLWVNRNIVPFHDKEYYEAEELYEKLRHIFKVLAGHITDKLGF